jgi:hypothetical protein
MKLQEKEKKNNNLTPTISLQLFSTNIGQKACESRSKNGCTKPFFTPSLNIPT